MRHKEKLLKLLRSAVETPLEEAAVEDFINKVDGDGLKIEQVDETHQKFNGIIYGKNREDRYFKMITLHRAVWTYYCGEIPDGYDVHHIDFNPENNDISNLMILSKSDHMKLHKNNRKPQKPPKKKTFKCIVCGKEYEAFDNGHNLYCSEKCFLKYRDTKLQVETRHCLSCGKEYEINRYKPQKFCSQQCWLDYQQAEYHIVKTCPICGKEFSTLKTKNQKYCSIDCSNKSMHNRKTIVCATCGKEFEVKISDNNRKYCSRDCYEVSRH